MIRYQVSLDKDEAAVLCKWARAEMRDPRDQIRFVLLNELQRRGLLSAPTEQAHQVIEKPENKD